MMLLGLCVPTPRAAPPPPHKPQRRYAEEEEEEEEEEEDLRGLHYRGGNQYIKEFELASRPKPPRELIVTMPAFGGTTHSVAPGPGSLSLNSPHVTSQPLAAARRGQN